MLGTDAWGGFVPPPQKCPGLLAAGAQPHDSLKYVLQGHARAAHLWAGLLDWPSINSAAMQTHRNKVAVSVLAARLQNTPTFQKGIQAVVWGIRNVRPSCTVDERLCSVVNVVVYYWGHQKTHNIIQAWNKQREIAVTLAVPPAPCSF
tara:strand:+ start:582 stop:1025 length:444 start_codon:yes stop_codon:yes gene_type:complete